METDEIESLGTSTVRVNRVTLDQKGAALVREKSPALDIKRALLFYGA